MWPETKVWLGVAYIKFISAYWDFRLQWWSHFFLFPADQERMLSWYLVSHRKSHLHERSKRETCLGWPKRLQAQPAYHKKYQHRMMKKGFWPRDERSPARSKQQKAQLPSCLPVWADWANSEANSPYTWHDVMVMRVVLVVMWCGYFHISN